MILDELVLHDVGSFAGRNLVELTPLSAKKPIVLIGGMNGSGKTTILESIHLALYGSLATTSSRKSASYDSYLRSLIHSGANPSQGSCVELAFHAHSEGDVHSYRIIRTWKVTPSGTRDKLRIERNGSYDRALTSTWAESVDAFLPRGIAGLFFFDGEQIESLADLDQSREVLGSALSSLLGLDLVDRLITDLSAIKRRHRDARVPDDQRHKLDAVQDETTLLRKRESELVQQLAIARSSVERAEKSLHQAAEKWRTEGGELIEQQNMVRQNLEERIETDKGLDEEMRDYAGGSSPLLLVQDLLRDAARQSILESAAERDRIIADVLAERDSSTLSVLKDMLIAQSALTAVERFFEEDQRQRASNTQVQDITGGSDSGRLSFMAEQGLKQAKEQLEALIERRSASRSRLEAAERMLAAIPDLDSISDFLDARNRAETGLMRAQTELHHVEEQLEMSRKARARGESVYERTLAMATDATLEAEDDLRVVTHIDHVQVTLGKLKEAATAQHLERISSLIMEALRQLLRKSDLVTAVNIDSETNAVELTGSMGQSISAQQLSAGERQLLAVAILWGLAQAAGQPLPVVIDTPLGRLDSSHRGLLIDRYFPHASHQVILLSTDTEIDELAEKRLQKWVGRSYRLEFDQTTSSTSVAAGYFWEK